MIPLFKVFMADSAVEEAANVLKSGYIGQGNVVDVFENQLKYHFDNNYVLTFNSGTSALHLALHLLKQPYGDWEGMEDGDEVLATPLTCLASNMPILANNLKIKWVDIDPETLNMDLDDLARKISPKTKAIMLVHWGGYPNDLDKIKEIQEQAKEMYGFKPAVIEDGAHSMGTTYKGKFLGNHGNIVMYSLQAIKHITSIDGGLLVLPHSQLYRKSRLLRWYGIERNGLRRDFRCEDDVNLWGYKFHMNDVCAAVGLENFKHLGDIVGKHINNAHYYDKELKDVKGVTLLKREKGFGSSFWIYSMLVERRDDFYRYMKECGIMVSQVHERNDKHTFAKEYRTQLPNLEKTIDKVVSIPVGWWVTEKDREYIVNCIKKGW